MAENESGRRHTRDDVARTALRILDDHGLPDLTMRRLAAALTVQPSALYHHFPNKQMLLADLADRIVATGPAPAVTTGWTDAVRTAAAALRDALLAHRDGAEVVASTLALGLGSSTALDRLVDAVAQGGFDEAISRQAATALLHFVLGQVSYEQQRMQYDSLGVLTQPTVAAADLPAADFAFGIALLVGGLERLAAELPPRRELSRPRKLSRPRT